MSRYFSPVLYVLLMLVGCMAFISIAGVRIGLFEPSTGFSMVRQSVFASLVLSLCAIVSLFICRKESNIVSQRFFILVLTVSLVYSTMWIVFYIKKSELPNINDVTTDLSAPPVYMNVGFTRKSSENPVGYDYSFIELQKKYYSELKPVFSNKDQQVIHLEVMKLISERNWEVVSNYIQGGVVEATARTPIFGFRDDVVIRLSEMGNGDIRIDMRSSSRVGNGDYGVNADRVLSFMKDLSARLTASPMPNMASIR